MNVCYAYGNEEEEELNRNRTRTEKKIYECDLADVRFNSIRVCVPVPVFGYLFVYTCVCVCVRVLVFCSKHSVLFSLSWHRGSCLYKTIFAVSSLHASMMMIIISISMVNCTVPCARVLNKIYFNNKPNIETLKATTKITIFQHSYSCTHRESEPAKKSSQQQHLHRSGESSSKWMNMKKKNYHEYVFEYFFPLLFVLHHLCWYYTHTHFSFTRSDCNHCWSLSLSIAIDSSISWLLIISFGKQLKPPWQTIQKNHRDIEEKLQVWND